MKNYVIMDNWTISQSLQRPCYQTSLHVALRGTKQQTDATCEATRLEIHGSKAIFAICYRAVGTVLTVAIFLCPPARRPADHSPMVSACEATSRPLTDGVRLRGNQPTTHRWCPPARRPADHSPMVSSCEATSRPLTDGVCLAELLHDAVVDVAVVAQLQLHQVHLHLAVLHKHALLDHLPRDRLLQHTHCRTTQLYTPSFPETLPFIFVWQSGNISVDYQRIEISNRPEIW